MPRVSVIMPMYNCKAYIEEAIRSLQAQTYSDWELIVADDGSTDGTSGIVAAMAETDARISLIRLPVNKGTWAARNAAIQEAHGEWLCLMDADDLSHAKRLERSSVFFNDPGVSVIYSDAWFTKDPPAVAPGGEYAGEPDYQMLSSAELLPRVLWGRITGPSAIYRRELVLKAGAYRRCRIEDADLMLRVLSRNRSMRAIHINERLYIYRLHGGQKTRKKIATDLGTIWLMLAVITGRDYLWRDRIHALSRAVFQTGLLLYHLTGLKGNPFRLRFP